MMDHDFILHLKSLGVVLRNDNGRLLCNAPKGVLTPELLTRIRSMKDELLLILAQVESGTAQPLPSIVKRPTGDGAPMTFAQQRLWFLDQLQPDTSVYNMSWALAFNGQLDIHSLERALNEVVRRHNVLRTRFGEKEGQGWQYLRDMDIRITPVDIHHVVNASDSETLQDYLKGEADRPFNLSMDPLIRVALIRAGDQKHVFLIVIHHIIFDGWSFDIFIQELFALYTAFHNGQSSSLPEMARQYSDFAYWQQSYFTDTELARQLEFWKRKLGNAPSQLELPLDYSRPLAQTFNGAQVQTMIGDSLVQASRNLAIATNASIFMVMLSVFKLLIHRLSGQTDIIIGAPFAGRRMKETEGMIGFFVNTVVLRTVLSGELSFRGLLDRVRDVVLEAQPFQDMPFEKIVESLALQRDLSRTPLFQVFFNHIRSQFRAQPDLLDVKPSLFEGYQGEVQAKFDLSFYVEEDESTIQLRIVYNSDLFTSDRVGVMLEQYTGLLEQVVAQPDLSIGDYCLVSGRDRTVLPDPSQLIEKKWAGSITQQLAHWSQVQGKHIAVEDIWSSLSYGELEQLSNRLSQRLMSSGIGSGDVVAVYGDRSAGIVVALLGIMKAGAAFLILDPSYPMARLTHMVEDGDPRGLVEFEATGPASKELNNRQYAFRLVIPRTKEKLKELLAGDSKAPIATMLEPDQTAYIIFTSGTMGRPKGIVGTHRPLSHFLMWHCNQFGISPSDRFSMLSGLSHDPLLRDIFTPLWAGARLCIPHSEEMLIPKRLQAWMQAKQITVAHLTPAMSHVLTEGAEEKFTALRYLFFGGEVLSRRTIERIRRLTPGVCCINYYGATETPQAMGYHVVKPEGGANLPEHIPVGRGIEGAQLVILNKSGKRAGVGELGEICVRSPYLSQGYLNDEELTGEKFIVNSYNSQDKLYKTGDLGRYQPDGQVMFFGRRDSQVSIRGFRVEIKEVEALLASYPGVRDCAVIIKERGPEDKFLRAFAVVHDVSQFDAADLKNFLRRYLPNYMVPEAIVGLDELPLTPNGKIDFRQLAEIKLEPIEQFPNELPHTEMELCLARIWKELLGLNTISVHDNFFDIGGHSLLSIQVITRLEKEIGIRINPGEFTYQTLGQMATSMEKQIGLIATSSSVHEKNNLFNSIKNTIVKLARRE